MLLSTSATASTRPTPRQTTSTSSVSAQEAYADSRTHGYQGPTRHVRLPRATAGGSAAIAKSEDKDRCVIAGRESLRILRISPPESAEAGGTAEHRFAAGKGGFRVEASRNFWDGSGLHIDSANTDVVWAHGIYSNKILTSARNGELIMWDLHKSGPSKYERRTRDHSRSIHALSYSSILEKYCVTGSADGDLRVWDLRDLSKSIMWIRHPGPVRAVVFSPIQGHPLQAISALDNGGIYRWDLSMGQRGQLDRILAAHSGPILTLDWTISSSSASSYRTSQSHWYGSSSTALGLLDEIIPGSGGLQGATSLPSGEVDATGMGWLASGGLDRCVKVWDLTAPMGGSHISYDPAYTLRTAYPVRRVLWRPGYECELAVVAHTDQGVNSSVDLHTAGGGQLAPPSVVTGGGAGFMSALSSPRIGPAGLSIENHEPAQTQGPLRNDGGAPVEIWDVRRGFIAKWVINDSIGEGGVSDIAFADSHAIWAQHSSGTFSQLDLRASCKPLDAVSSTAVTWDPIGTLAFVTDQRKRWEVPYDDVKPEKRQVAQEWHSVSKAKGDPPFMPTAQTCGTITLDAIDDLTAFVHLAQNLVYEGGDRRSICAHNAKVSLHAGKIDAAQTWLMLDNLLMDLVADVSKVTSPASQVTPNLPHCASAPAAIPTLQTASTPGLPQRSVSTDTSGVTRGQSRSPSIFSKENVEGSLTLGRHSPHPETPASSTASSPRKSSTSLPQFHPTLLSRRESNAGQSQVTRPRLSSSYRRPSSSLLSSPSLRSTHSDPPNDGARGTSSLKHVGEGALDDSDSSESEEDFALVVPSRSGSDDEDASLSRSLYLHRPNTAVHPSPLAHQPTWTEDEDDNDDDSPSPGSSSDSDDAEPSPKTKAGRMRTKGSARSRTRSRSSTVASLAVHAPSPKLVRHSSSTSIRTVIASIAPCQDEREGDLQRQETVRDLSKQPVSAKPSPTHNRTRSTTFADEVKIGLSRLKAAPVEESASSAHTPAACSEHVIEVERRFRDLGWNALRDALEDYAEQGDVQMCAHLSLVASKELKISATRTLRFVDAYISTLIKLRLHTAAAYLRKYVDVEEIRSATALQTTIYTCCSRCRKPILAPAGRLGPSGRPLGNYAYCTACKSAISHCSICRLPVRALAFTCSVCMHGGHQECYRNYYMRRPMAYIDSGQTVPEDRTAQPPNPPLSRPRGRTSSRSGSLMHDSDSDEGSIPRAAESAVSGGEVDRPYVTLEYSLQGHVCAAGCGHFCWATRDQA
ncbi:uncharacterized protein C8Q71DRAFT_788214 [Rhodofomes roseus]|uniref:WD40 repeat protein n=1 Tax=Rhodofomes roseus TaxID=34475 RepID=A0ABQ8K035_9APHY|nr:uncharacterized protein C8Q71DRAFT_788214 [Rhodofomes roseus]KAH9830000.1 hypothetical protein C8Q71DRAFT_788214 [Rhodofomes roseus]